MVGFVSDKGQDCPTCEDLMKIELATDENASRALHMPGDGFSSASGSRRKTDTGVECVRSRVGTVGGGSVGSRPQFELEGSLSRTDARGGASSVSTTPWWRVDAFEVEAVRARFVDIE